jgi:hypothetical protein
MPKPGAAGWYHETWSAGARSVPALPEMAARFTADGVDVDVLSPMTFNWSGGS